MTLRRKFNGAKLCTEAWDFCVEQSIYAKRQEEESGDAERRREIPKKPKSVYVVFNTEMVGERSLRGEVRAEALVDCREVRMPE